MVIVENAFKMSKKLEGDMKYQVVRNWFDDKEVDVIVSAPNGTGGKRIEKYKTEKTDEEIREFFNQKFEEYQPKVDKMWFILKTIPLTKFDSEFDKFFEERIGQETDFFGKRQ
ncbi:hypothetical protein CVD28_00120 [Bacillus sp. M6-12]|uniref:hypothetical protein n=1 Tax=Bacillus sp. M6-12 TaxID=2054166 RepID=UPI000C75EF1F|nr:hypothetical protein [Bacillus sp. M6-12]PLS18842.1 hypothetical protein CVD28_00120 [Bacillus sp. M6-12]